jgi:poly(hydroxyalkanoate) depolymerase family esterase
MPAVSRPEILDAETHRCLLRVRRARASPCRAWYLCTAATNRPVNRWGRPANKEPAPVLSLRKTIASLARNRSRWEAVMRASTRARAVEAVPTCLEEVFGFGTNPGNLRMFTYLPRRLAPEPALVVVLHGCTQTAAGYDLGAGWSTLADRYGFALLVPEQLPSNNPKRCFNWFVADDTRRDRGEALSIRQMIETMVVDKGIDRRRVFVTGLSAGGAMTSVMLACYPEAFAGGAIIAGLPYGAATNVQEAFESMFQSPPARRANGAISCGERRRTPGDGPGSPSGMATPTRS